MVYPLLFMFLGAFTTNDRFLDTILLPIPNTLSYFVQRMVASGLKG